MSPGNGDCWLPAWLPGYIGFADVGMLENSVSCGAAEGAAKANRCWPVVMGAHHTARRMLRRYLREFDAWGRCICPGKFGWG
jgi:hypothetical protein